MNLIMKNKLIYLFIWILIILSLYFLNIKINENSNNKAYSRWMDTAFDLIMKQAKNQNCDTVNISNESEEIKLINIDCIKK